MNNTSTIALQEGSCFTSDTMSVRIIRMIPYILIMPISIFGNVLVMLIVYKDSSLHKCVNYFIVNMAISDLLITMVYMPRVLTIMLWGYKWLLSGSLGYALCKSVSFVYESSILVSILTIVAISVDRLFAVIWPLKSTITKTKGKIIILVIWGVALVSRAPIPFAIELVQQNSYYFCFVFFDKTFYPGADMLFYKITIAIFYATPLTTITIAYTCIITTLYKRTIPNETTDQSIHIDRINCQVLRMVLTVVGSFILCWMLYFIVMFLRIYDTYIPCNIFYMRMLLAHSNCAINPCLYITLSSNYRQGFRSVIKGIKSWCCFWSKKNQTDSMSMGTENRGMIELTVSNGCIYPLSYTLNTD